MEPCPVCKQEAGFHDHAKHDECEVPRELILQHGWLKPQEEADEELVREGTEVKACD